MNIDCSSRTYIKIVYEFCTAGAYEVTKECCKNGGTADALRELSRKKVGRYYPLQEGA